MATDGAFLRQLRATFQVEALEHLQAMATGLLALEKDPQGPAAAATVETVFRAAHSLKGAARAVDMRDVEAQCQALEEIFSVWRGDASAVGAARIDSAHRILNAITRLVNPPTTPVPAATRAPSARSTPAAAEAPAAQGMQTPAPAEDAGQTVRIAVAKLDARLVEAEEMLSVKLLAGQRAQDLQALARGFAQWRGEWTHVEPQARALRRPGVDGAAGDAARVLEFLDWNLDYMRSLERSVQVLAGSAQTDSHTVGKLVDDLLEDSKKLLLLPFATLAAPLPKMVRDLCHDQGKEAQLVLRGEDVEIDKRVLEEMKDPLAHLLRNAVDHGVEPPQARRRAGKPARATLTVAMSRLSASQVELMVSDDGAGIDPQRVREAAVRHGLLGEQDARALDDAAAQALVFQSALSTRADVSHISGRGLGLAIVREKAETLGGTVSVESHGGRGTLFRIRLPAMLATFRGILIECAARPFVVPTFQVERVARVKPADIRTVEGRETMVLGGATLPLVRLRDVLGLPAAGARQEDHGKPLPVAVLGSGDARVAFIVDAVLDEQEVLVKPLAPPLVRLRNIAGATVLGSGRVAPILHVADLLKSARRVGAAPAAADTPVARRQAVSILVAEDSITSRMLIKGILEAAGYRVTTAADGMEAFALLRAGTFDVLVSDVEMPRLNGFGLTQRVRAEPALAHLPVILVTALETQQDRERGFDAGANAYIAKSSFDQANLVEAVRRLAEVTA